MHSPIGYSLQVDFEDSRLLLKCASKPLVNAGFVEKLL